MVMMVFAWRWHKDSASHSKHECRSIGVVKSTTADSQIVCN